MTKMYVARCACGAVVAAGLMDQYHDAHLVQIKDLANRGYVVTMSDEEAAPPTSEWALNPCNRNDCTKARWMNTKPGFHTV